MKTLLAILLLCPLVAFNQPSLTAPQIMAAVSQRYLAWQHVRDQVSGAPYYHWDSIPQGAYYSLMRLQQDSTFSHSRYLFYSIDFVPNNCLQLSDGTQLITMTTDVPRHDPPLERVLIAIDEGGKLHYLSGNLLLDPLPGWNEGDWVQWKEEAAHMRTFFLQPNRWRQIGSDSEVQIFSAFSVALGRWFLLKMYNRNKFLVYLDGERHVPYLQVGDFDDMFPVRKPNKRAQRQPRN